MIYRQCLLRRLFVNGGESKYYVCWLPDILASEGSEISIASLGSNSYRIETVYKHRLDGKELDHIGKVQRRSQRILEQHA